MSAPTPEQLIPLLQLPWALPKLACLEPAQPVVSCQVLHWLMVTSLSPEAPAAKCSPHSPPPSPCRAPVSLLPSPQHEKACGMKDLVPQTLPPRQLLCPSSGSQASVTRVPTKQVPAFTDPTLWPVPGLPASPQAPPTRNPLGRELVQCRHPAIFYP